MSDHDFRDQEPVWVRYAEYIGGGSDKFYEVRIDMDDNGLFYVTKRWGRRPDTGAGQIKVESSQNMSYAMGVADGMLAEKLRKGYRLTERPRGASNKVFHEQGADYYGDEDAEAF
jgi:predicted DNA-binding WGR domain protein